MLIRAGNRIVNMKDVESATYTPGHSEIQLVLADKAVGQVRHLQRLTQPEAGEVFRAIMETAVSDASPLVLWDASAEKSRVINAAAASMIAYDSGNGRVLSVTMSGEIRHKRGDEAEAVWEKLQLAAERTNHV